MKKILFVLTTVFIMFSSQAFATPTAVLAPFSSPVCSSVLLDAWGSYPTIPSGPTPWPYLTNVTFSLIYDDGLGDPEGDDHLSNRSVTLLPTDGTAWDSKIVKIEGLLPGTYTVTLSVSDYDPIALVADVDTTTPVVLTVDGGMCPTASIVGATTGFLGQPDDLTFYFDGSTSTNSLGYTITEMLNNEIYCDDVDDGPGSGPDLYTECTDVSPSDPCCDRAIPENNLLFAWAWRYEGVTGLDEPIFGEIGASPLPIGEDPGIGLTGFWQAILHVSEVTTSSGCPGPSCTYTEIAYDETRMLLFAVFKDFGCFISTAEENIFKSSLGYILRSEFFSDK